MTLYCATWSIPPHYGLLPHSAIFRLTVTSGQPLTIPCTTSQTHILRPTLQPSKTHQTITNYCANWSILPHYALLPHLAIFRLTVTSSQPLAVPCTMQSDSYSPTDPSTFENTSNHHQLLCYWLHSTSLCTFTSFSYLPTDRYFRSTFGRSMYHESDSYSPTAHSTIENTSNRHPLLCYLVHSSSSCTSTSFSYLPTDRYFRSIFDHSRYHAVRLIFSDRPFNLRKHIKPSPITVLLAPFYLTMHFYLIQLSSD